MSWKKTVIGITNTWLGYQVCARTAWATMTPTKAVIISQLLMDLMLGIMFKRQEIEEGVGRLNWATQAFPYMRPFPPTNVCMVECHEDSRQTVETHQGHGNMHLLSNDAAASR